MKKIKNKKTTYFSQAAGLEFVARETAAILRGGGVICYPTETVYGIGCGLYDTQAAKKIYRYKNRPPLNPLTANIYDIGQVESLCRDIPDSFYSLAARYLPGPLTIILKKRSEIPDYITSNLDTIGIRMPRNQVILNILKEFGEPIAGTSANISSKKSSLSAMEALAYFAGKADAVVDGGPCSVGVESTVLSLAGHKPILIREGAVKKEELEHLLKRKLSL